MTCSIAAIDPNLVAENKSTVAFASNDVSLLSIKVVGLEVGCPVGCPVADSIGKGINGTMQIMMLVVAHILINHTCIEERKLLW